MADDTEVEKQNWHWRNSQRPARFFNLDARAALPYLILLFYARPITLALTVLSTLVFQFLEKRGMTVPAAMRALRLWIIGYERPAWYSIRHRKMKDYGGL